MIKEEFLKTIGGYQAEISALHDKIVETTAKYLKEAEKPYPVGSKVRVITNERGTKIVQAGIVTDYTLNLQDDITPVIMKMKKDGTPHPTQKIWCTWRSVIEPITE